MIVDQVIFHAAILLLEEILSLLVTLIRQDPKTLGIVKTVLVLATLLLLQDVILALRPRIVPHQDESILLLMIVPLLDEMIAINRQITMTADTPQIEITLVQAIKSYQLEKMLVT